EGARASGESRQGSCARDGHCGRSRRRGRCHRHAGRRRPAPARSHRPRCGPRVARRRRSGSRRAGAQSSHAVGAALYQLAVRYARLAHRGSGRPGCPDGLSGALAARCRSDPAAGAGLRLRDGVPAGRPHAGVHDDLRARTDGVRRAAQPLSPLDRYLAAGPCLHAIRREDHLRSAMNILISNDDGILARGLAVLGEVCAAIGQVTVVAPDREQSGTAHSLTPPRPPPPPPRPPPLHATRRPDGAFQVDGTPTDCVLLAIGMLMPQKPDFVVSGINHGQNMGEDVFYSGTVAAAMEGLVAGVPSIAVSYAGSDLDVLESHKSGLRSLLQRILEVKDFPKETLLNINLPALPGDQVKGAKVTHLGSRVFSEEIALMKDPWGKEIYWI